ncbi:cob(I)alamin adenosyltransferase [Aequitasia blattaphilus]|uniref:Cob(I)yrinic acid a,c-diamide adenosyltransferase n=1 Tax=Aequitasia blattaphilus TaxID=2949332 RepID=A0ABT1E7Z0_9FIRM|nr:cob(I)yrinic acid a,c-diamide adenosyltransferase [Aequitasia blattaphilus]MCP1101941.1 cob(I)yrinic acid a,c-diamide adenosyltransferase [Aequitasia blattaphilus]MCR8614581.1 cob(I)yrinic acid a,c-diamide adenosyltransferase [Aequitasia blattaphilus]
MAGTGRIHVYYGDGKGKTTAAVGAAIRGAGSGMKVLFYQFLKDNSSSERRVLEMIPLITCLPGKDRVKFFKQLSQEEKKELRRYYTKALDEIVKFCSSFDLLILDEILDAVSLNLLSEEKVFRFLEHKPQGLEIILTGHVITEEMKARGQYVTQMKKIKHPYDEGTTAREGIEY